MKTCRKCEVSKPLDSFWKKSSAKDGLQGQCISCMSDYAATQYLADIENRRAKSLKYIAENRDRIRAKNLRYYAENKARLAAQRKISRAENRGILSQRHRDWRAANPVRVREYRTTYWVKNKVRIQGQRKSYFLDHYRKTKSENPSHYAQKASERRARTLRAKPSWADDQGIAAFYQTAHGLSMLTGEWYHVDHIVPLKGKTVCGLHTQANLRVMLGVENISKSNKYWPDQP